MTATATHILEEFKQLAPAEKQEVMATLAQVALAFRVFVARGASQPMPTTQLEVQSSPSHGLGAASGCLACFPLARSRLVRPFCILHASFYIRFQSVVRALHALLALCWSLVVAWGWLEGGLRVA